MFSGRAEELAKGEMLEEMLASKSRHESMRTNSCAIRNNFFNNSS
jgi:hypothetical protein